MLKFVNQSLSTFSAASGAGSAARLKTHHPHLRLLSASSDVSHYMYWCAAPAATVQSRSAHGYCKLTSLRLRTVGSTAYFLSNPTNFRNKQQLWPSFFRTRHQYAGLSSSFSTSAESGITEKELKREIDDLTDKFMETRELLEDAMEAKGTVYFNDDLKDAKESVQETLVHYEDLMAKLSEEQERNVRRTIGLKMEELRAQEMMIDESLKD